MKTIIETIPYRGYNIECHYDEPCDNPNEWCYNDFAFIVYDHRDFCVKREGFDPDDIYIRMEEKKRTYKGYYFFPVYAYIHSGVSLSLGKWFNVGFYHQYFDVSFKGFCLVKREKGKSWREKGAYEIAESVIKTWNQYLHGEVYGYVSEVGSCWNFYGDDGYKYMIDEAKLEIDDEIDRIRKEHFNKLKVMIKNKVPLEKRKCLTV